MPRVHSGSHLDNQHLVFIGALPPTSAYGRASTFTKGFHLRQSSVGQAGATSAYASLPPTPRFGATSWRDKRGGRLGWHHAGVQARGAESQRPIERAFSPHDFIVALILGRWPRLIWNAPLALQIADECGIKLDCLACKRRGIFEKNVGHTCPPPKKRFRDFPR